MEGILVLIGKISFLIGGILFFNTGIPFLIGEMSFLIAWRDTIFIGEISYPYERNITSYCKDFISY